MDSNIADEIDYNTSDSEPFHKVKLVNDGTLVKIEKTTNPNPLVLRLRRYVEPNSEETASNNHDSNQYPWEEVSRASVSEILNSGDHSMTIEEHKSITNDHHETESQPYGLRRSHRTNHDQNSRKNYRKDFQEKLRIYPEHFVSRRNPSDTTSSTLHKEETVSATPNKAHEKAPPKKAHNEPKETQKTPKEQPVVQIKVSPPVPVIDKEAEERQKAKYKLACEHFGITHPLVQQHYKFIKSYYKEYVCSPYTFQQTGVDSLELKKSHKITKGFYLLRLGQPFIPGYHAREEPQTSSAIEFYDGFVTLRKYASFLNPGFLVYYYQTIIYLEEISQYVYVMVPEDREELVLFHSSPVKLQEFIFDKIKEANKETTRYRKYKSQKKDFRFPETSPLILRHKIFSLYKLQSNFDVLLENMMQQVIGGGPPVAVIPDAENVEKTEKTEKTEKEKEKDKKEIFFTKAKKILADDHMTQTLKTLFKKKVDHSDLPKKVNFAEFFFGLSHPKGVLLHELLGNNQALSFGGLKEKFKHHLSTISPFCEIKNLEIKLDDPEALGLGPTYKYQIERLLPDYSHPSQYVWFIFDVYSKVNVAEKTRQLCYSIHHKCQFKDELTTTGDNPENCLMKFLKKYTKSGASRRIMLEWAERVFDNEIRSHENKDSVVEMLMSMYSFPEEKEEEFERDEEEMDIFDSLIEKKHPGLYEIDQENHADPEKKKLAAQGWEVRDCFESDANIEILDGKFVFTSEKMSEKGIQEN